PAAADVPAGLVARAALPDQDTARRHMAAAVYLDAQPLTVRLAAVLGRTLTFFMRHCCSSLGGKTTVFANARRGRCGPRSVVACRPGAAQSASIFLAGSLPLSLALGRLIFSREPR